MNLQPIQKSLSVGKALLIENPVDLFYLTGESFSAGSLLIEEKRAALFLDGRYEEVGKKLSLPLFNRDDEILIRECASLQEITIDGSFTSLDRGKKLESLLPEKVVSRPSPLLEWRKIKSENESEKMKRAAEIACRGYDFLLTILHEGVSEEEVALLLEIYFRKEEGAISSFDPIIAFGENSALPHAKPTKRRLKRGDMVLLDFGAKKEGYCSDMTRSFFFQEVDPRLAPLYGAVLEAQEMTIAHVRPGIQAASLDEEVHAFFKEKGFEKEIKHSLGHGIGLEVHEAPILRKNSPPFLLEKGMCITIEPGLYLAGVGGVRIEDTLLITEKGSHSLTNRSKKRVHV